MDLGIDEDEFEERFGEPFPDADQKIIFYDLIGVYVKSHAVMWENKFQNEAVYYYKGGWFDWNRDFFRNEWFEWIEKTGLLKKEQEMFAEIIKNEKKKLKK